ncbi:helix-turn-helix transcriptional regulator [Mangrovicella endophytica]|uniref:helix-turn-helix transcriptional regulator n=1 Tax=Mangrovicella endophytica TaxID=2066697 RepID=UPI000DF2CC51|nr:helix-turn-helix domain-containing protein [Mangrovicella endophytica]
MFKAERTNFFTPAQCRAARGLLDWTQAELAERAAVSRSTIRDFEGGAHELHRASAEHVRTTFEAAGVIFVTLRDGTPGVCLRTLAKGPEKKQEPEA